MAVLLNNAFLVYLSTDALFDGKNEYHREDDELNPINTYSSLKAETENYINRNYQYCCVIRSRFYGWNIIDKECFVEQVISRLRDGKEISCYTDNYSNQLLANNMAGIIEEIFKKKITGILNIADPVKLSRYEIARITAETFGLPVKLVKPASFLKNAYKTRRAQDTSLSDNKAKCLLATPIIPFEDGIKLMKVMETNGYKEALKIGK